MEENKWTGGQEFIAWSGKMLQMIREIIQIDREQRQIYSRSIKLERK